MKVCLCAAHLAVSVTARSDTCLDIPSRGNYGSVRLFLQSIMSFQVFAGLQ